MPTVAELEQLIRNYVNLPRRHRALSSQKRSFDVVCAALDVIGDVEEALYVYTRMPEPSDVAARYIVVYGVLQLMIAEQDAVLQLARVFGAKVSLSPELRGIRDIRNYAIGHAVPNQPTKPTGHIARSTLSIRSFSMMCFWPDRPYERQDICLDLLVDKQRESLQHSLVQIADHLRTEEMDHRNNFRKQKLADIFHKSVPYLCSKLEEATISEVQRASGEAALITLKEYVKEFEAALERRGEHEAASGILKSLIYPMDKLSSFFTFGDLDEEAAEIFAEFVRTRIEQLTKAAKEIDARYASDELPR